MASLNYTVEDGSPLIDYIPGNAWIDANGNDDALTTSYSGASYHFTTTKDAAASFTFTGTGVWVFGGKRPNYGDYSISVDGVNVTTANAGSSQDSVKQVLGFISNMDLGTHTVVLSSSGSSRIDIDYIEVETRLPGDQITTTTIEDSDPAISYAPAPSDWTVNNKDVYTGSSLHFSQTRGASATVSFSGDAVGVYGTTSPDHADVQIVVDEQTMATLPGGSGGRTSGLHSQVLLYFKDNLGPGTHSLSIISDQQSDTAPFIDLDAVLVYSATNTSDSQGSSASDQHHIMGNLIWHDLARYISITASVYAVWSGFYGLFYRKFFWDFVGAHLRDPGGLQPAPGAKVFITLVVKNPIIQIFAMLIGFFMIALEFPVPQLKGGLQRSFALKIVLLFFQTFVTILYYQGTNAALWSLIAAGCYARAQVLGETMEEAKENRGKGGRA
ncbi:hypothetical protein D9758_001876 [Tetrapyrgos nigripes]|uniref:DUF7727 domain-containing protein n=1 Tax=Tetrapyrgos nigripes TaxID=182062 RepID=A0A8H5LV43_9AGAR|nr:hypothetical protein D9758_001876 [Tetrapyrgos nigripes]